MTSPSLSLAPVIAFTTAAVAVSKIALAVLTARGDAAPVRYVSQRRNARAGPHALADREGGPRPMIVSLIFPDHGRIVIARAATARSP